MSDKIKRKTLAIYKKGYPDFGPTLVTEKLLGLDGIKISDETLRKWLIKEGLWEKRCRRSVYRQWRSEGRALARWFS